MKAKEFLDQLNPQSVVFEENLCYEYTERQLVLFAELYHKHIAKNNDAFELVSSCSNERADNLEEQINRIKEFVGFDVLS